MKFKKIIIVLPLYNDWKSAKKLIEKIDSFFSKEKSYLSIIIINDSSPQKINIKFKKLFNIKKIEIVNLNRNLGSQKAIYIGLKKIKNEKNSIIVVMDSDGEDDPSKLKDLINKANLHEDKIIFAKRTKRTENFILQLLNNIRLILSFLITGKFLNIGNFSAFSSKNLKKLLSNKNLALAFSSGAIKNVKNIYLLGIDKKKRYFGKSKVNLNFLLIHSLNLISVFFKQAFIRTSIIGLILLFLNFSNYLIFALYLLINICLILNYFLKINENFEKKIVMQTKRIR